MILNNSSRGLLRENGKILFIEYEINGVVFYSIPGGSVEIGESLKDCVIREFMEEVGIEIEVNDLILLNEFISPNPNAVSERWKKGIHQIESIFKVSRSLEAKPVTSPRKEDEGMTGMKWLTVEDLSKVTYYPEMPIDWFFSNEKEFQNIYRTKQY